MDFESEDPFVLDVDATDAYTRQVGATIAKDRAKTKNIVAIILVSAAVASFPLYMVMVAVRPELAEQLSAFFDKWITVIAPLAGAAVGVGAMNQK